MSAIPNLQVIGHVSSRPSIYPQQSPEYEFTHEASAVRVVVVIQGRSYLVPRCSVEMNAHGAADSAEVTLTLKGSPDFTAFLARSESNTSAVPVQIYVGVYQGQPPDEDVSISGKTLIFSGQVDQYSINYGEDSVLFLCRSLAALLIDNRITGLSRNMRTAGNPRGNDFVSGIAKQYGLTPVIMLPKGQYPLTVAELYAHDFAVGIQNERIWDILQEMARIDDADVWVTGSTLYYVAPQLIPRTTIDLKYGRDIEKLTVTHSPLFSKNIRVDVRTFTRRTSDSSIQRIASSDSGEGGYQSVSVSKTVTSNPEFGTPNTTTTSVSSTGVTTTKQTTVLSTGAQSTSASAVRVSPDGPLIYPINPPGMALQAANQLAQATWRRLSMMEYTANIRFPLTRENVGKLSITSVISLHGLPTQAANNKRYWPRKIRLDIDVDSGASVEVEAVTVTLPGGQV